MRTTNRLFSMIFTSVLLAEQAAMGGQIPASPAPATSQAANSDTKPLAFDAVSIRPTNAGAALSSQMANGESIISSQSMMRFTADGFTAKNTSAKRLIGTAYSIKADLIAGGPDWSSSTGYDIQAKATSFDASNSLQLTKDQCNRMLQMLLAERFKLAIHYETKDAPIYEIVISKGGPKLHEATPGDTYRDGPNGPDSLSHPGMIQFVGVGQYAAQGVPLSDLANFLSAELHRPVVDKTGLTGKYDFALRYAPDSGPAADTAGISDPTILTAVQEQLGLRLESTKAPVKSLVIDHIEKPSEN